MTVTVTTTRGRVYVTQLNGHQVEVGHADEKVWYEQMLGSYQHDFAFEMASDRNDLDRLLMLELQAFRFNRFLSSGRDYEDMLLPDGVLDSYRSAMKGLGAEISRLKMDLGMGKAARDKIKESAGGYITELQKRAREHGIRRNKQVTTFICQMQALKSLIGTYDRSNALERDKIGLTSEADIVEWIRTEMIPEFEAVDLEFRQTSQKFWVGRL